MKKISINLPEEVVAAITDEGAREFRTLEQQASYLLLTWFREGEEKRQKQEKVGGTTGKISRESPSLLQSLG